MESKKILIIGIGNEFRNDDGIGLYIARKLKESYITNAKIVESNGDGAGLMDMWKDYDKVILIDAVQSNTEEQIVTLDLTLEKLQKEKKISTSHLFSVYDAVETSRAMNKLPQKLHFYGIRGEDFNYGNTISGKVQAASESIIQMILEEIAH